MGTRHTAGLQHLAPKMCQRASEDLQLIALIAVCRSVTLGVRPLGVCTLSTARYPQM